MSSTPIMPILQCAEDIGPEAFIVVSSDAPLWEPHVSLPEPHDALEHDQLAVAIRPEGSIDRLSNSAQHTAIQLVQQSSPLCRVQDDALDGAAIVQHALRKGLQRDECGFLDLVFLITS